MIEETELQDSQPDVQGEAQETTPQTEELGGESVVPNTVEELKQTNSELFARAKKAEEAAKQFQEELATYKPQATPPQPSADWQEVEKRVDLRMRDYTTEEISYIETYAKGANKDILDVEKEPFVQAAIKSMRIESKVEQVSPEGSSGSIKIEGKEWNQMSKAEREKNWESHRDQWRAKRQFNRPSFQ